MDDKTGKLEATEYIAVTLEEDGKMLGDLMMPADSIQGLSEDEVTRRALAAHRRLQVAQQMLDQQNIKEAAKISGPGMVESMALFAATICAVDILTVWSERAQHDSNERPYLERLEGPDAEDKALDRVVGFLTETVLEPLKKPRSVEHLYTWVWQHIIAGALEELEEEHGTETIAVMPDELFDKLLYQQVYEKQNVQEAMTRLLLLYAQDMARDWLEELDPQNRPLPELRYLMGLEGTPEGASDLTATMQVQKAPPASPNPFADELTYISTAAPGLGAVLAIFQAPKGWHDDESGNPRFVHRVDGAKLKGAFSYHIMVPGSSQDFALAQKELAHAILQDMGPDTAWLHMALLAYAAQTTKGEKFIIPRQIVYRVLGLDKRTDLTRSEKDARCFAEISRLMSLGLAITFLQLDGRQLDFNRRIGHLWDIGWYEYGQRYLTPEQVGEWTISYAEWQLQGRPGALWADPFLYGEPMRQIGVMAGGMIGTIDRRKAPLSAGLAVQLVFQSRFSPGEVVRIRNRDIIEFVGGDTHPEDRRLRHGARVQVMDAIFEQERWGWRVDFSEWPEDLRPDLAANQADDMLTGDGSEAAAGRWPEGYWEPFINAATRFVTPAPMLEANLKATKQLPAPRKNKRKTVTASEFKEARQRLGWTQKEAAQYLGVSQQLISYMENGRREIKAAYMRKLEQVKK